MKTIDIHVHLLNPEVRFKRLFDKISIHFFADGLGVNARELQTDPYNTYTSALVRSIQESKYIERICLFGVDSRLDRKGNEIHRDNTVCAMTDDVLALANAHSGSIIPFFSVNPLRPNALELIDEYVERGCKGAKFLQNYWGLDLNNKTLIPYYEKIREKGLPLIIHVGSEYAIDSFKEYEGIGMLRLPLESGVTVIAAHMGLGSINYKWRFWRNLSKDPAYFNRDYFTMLEMLEEHQNLFADISAILAPLRARALSHLAGAGQVHEKILFGTDYPVPFSIRHNTYDLPGERREEIGVIANPFDRYTTAMLEYFPADSPIYGNYRKVLNI